MKIGFIGLGNMGAAMAANLLKAGHEVTAYNRSPGKVAALAAQGARPAASVADACQGDVVVTMLANDDAVQAVTFGDDGILASLSEGAIHVSSSTVSTALAERLTEAHATAGQGFVAAQPGAHQLGPAVTSVFPGKERTRAAEFLRLRVHVVHELVDHGDGDLFDLGLGIGDFAHENVAGGVDAALGVGVEHGEVLSDKLVQGNVVLDVFRDHPAVFRRHRLEIGNGE